MALGIRTSKYRRVPNHGRSTIDGLPVVNIKGNSYYVDGTSGSNSNTGATPADAFATLTHALTKVSQFDVIYIIPKKMVATDTDPGSYAEAVTVSVPQLSIIGLSDNRTQGGLPQLKVGSGSAPIINVKAPGVYIANLGINGSGSTGGGIKLTDDGGATAASFGATIENCHFKNCVGSTATNAATGGAISLSGAPWQVRILNNRFYKNVGDIVLLDTSNAVPQDLIIEYNQFSGPAANVDCNVYLAGGSGVNGVHINNNIFPCLPALSSGVNVAPVVLTGCIGVLHSNTFGTTGKTYGAAANILVPTTVLMANNYQESGTAFIART